MTIPRRTAVIASIGVLLLTGCSSAGAVITVHGTERRCTFACPRCKVPAASRLLTTALVAALTAEGVPTVTLPERTLPANTLRRILPPDVVKFTCELAGTDYLAGAE